MGVYKSKHNGPQIDQAVDEIKNLNTRVNTLILENNFEQLNTDDKTIIDAINEVKRSVKEIVTVDVDELIEQNDIETFNNLSQRYINGEIIPIIESGSLIWTMLGLKEYSPSNFGWSLVSWYYSDNNSINIIQFNELIIVDGILSTIPRTLDMSNYQPKIDETLGTDSNEIVGAINEINESLSNITGSLGTAVVANPTETSTRTLEELKVGDTTYSVLNSVVVDVDDLSENNKVEEFIELTEKFLNKKINIVCKYFNTYFVPMIGTDSDNSSYEWSLDIVDDDGYAKRLSLQSHSPFTQLNLEEVETPIVVANPSDEVTDTLEKIKIGDTTYSTKEIVAITLADVTNFDKNRFLELSSRALNGEIILGVITDDNPQHGREYIYYPQIIKKKWYSEIGDGGDYDVYWSCDGVRLEYDHTQQKVVVDYTQMFQPVTDSDLQTESKEVVNAINEVNSKVSDIISGLSSEIWTFTMEDGSTVTKRVVIEA